VSLDPTTLELVIDPKSYRSLIAGVEVVERYPLEGKHYDQRQMKALEAIAKTPPVADIRSEPD